MDQLERVYRRTDSGLKAWMSKDSALAPEYRRILGLIQRDTPWGTLRMMLRRHADMLRLADLEQQGLIEARAYT